MAEDRSANAGFKVVDKRIFSIDGSKREGVLESEKAAASSPLITANAEKKPEPAPAPAAASTAAAEDVVDQGFAVLVNFLSENAMYQLGMISPAAGEPPYVDLAGARMMIDLLGVVRDKSRGNLSATESRMLEEVLFALHTRYVELQKKAAAKRK
jgi:hypothetical protein